MTRTITLIMVVAAMALTGVVPAALGAGRFGGTQERVDFWNYESDVKVSDSSPGIAPNDLALLYSSAGRASRPARTSERRTSRNCSWPRTV